MPNNIPLINGKAYSWAAITVIIGGATVIGIKKITYDDNTEKENGYGAGQMPIERGEGNYAATCSLTLTASENQALVEKAANGRIQDLGVFDVIVQYLVGTKRVKHVIRNCEFTGNKRDVSQGDKLIDVEHTLITSHIDWK